VVAVDAAPDAIRDRLLDAGERLIAARGLAATSVRAVCGEAGANVAAVHYHFGSKDSLVDAVLERRMGELTTRRLAMLEPLEAQAHPSTRAVIDALVRPLADFARERDGEGRAYVRFLAALYANDERNRIALAFTPQYERLAPVLARSLPDLAPGIVAFRLDLVSAPMVATLAEPEHALRHWPDTPTPRYSDLVDALVDAVTGMLTGGSS
jgi:AcrR family transcriptional regulator